MGRENPIEKRMARTTKNYITPQSLTAPKAMAPLVEAFNFIDSEKQCNLLIEQAAAAVYATDSGDSFVLCARKTTKEEISTVYELMKSIRPKDLLETLAAAQILVCHLLGMRKLQQVGTEDQILGLKLMRLSNEAMERLEKKRNGAHQNITVTYNNAGPSMQTLIPSTKE